MSSIKTILVVHNSYQLKGGEDTVVESEINLLRKYGHQVVTYFRSNHDIRKLSPTSVASQTMWSSRAASEISELIDACKPDVIHVHNTLPLISPSVYWAAEKADVPVVQTLHNFRLMCLSALYLREGKVCEDCVGSMPWRGIVRKCYRGSAAASSVLAGMLMLHRGLGTYRNKVSRYIALNNFCRQKFIEGGLPADLISVKPNFVDAPSPLDLPRRGILFVGRLSVEKGIESLTKAAALLPDAQLRVVGDGPQAPLLNDVQGVTSLGSLSGDAVRHEMNSAIALVVPSICYENFPRTIVEAYAAGLPVIASKTGSLAELVTEDETGLLFEPGNEHDMAAKMAWALVNPMLMAEMGRRARAKFEAEFTADLNYEQLIEIYELAQLERRNAK